MTETPERLAKLMEIADLYAAASANVLRNALASSLGEPVSQEAPSEDREELREAAMRARIAEIRARIAAATPGPWVQTWNIATGVKIWSDEQGSPPLFQVLGGVNHSRVTDADPIPQWQKNADLVRNAPSDLAALCNFVESLLASRSAFSGIPRTENEPSAQQMREALSGIECSLAEFCDESAPNRETMVADAARDAAAAIADLRRNRCRSGEMCSVDGCSSTAVAWRDERGVPYCDQCKRGVSRMRSRSRKTFNPIVLARLSASAPSPEDKGSDNG